MTANDYEKGIWESSYPCRDCGGHVVRLFSKVQNGSKRYMVMCWSAGCGAAGETAETDTQAAINWRDGPLFDPLASAKGFV